MPPKSAEKDEMLTALSKRILTAMLDDLIMDVSLQAHQEVLRGRAVCQICHTQCGSVHLPGTSSQGNMNGAVAGSSSRPDTPSSQSANEVGGKATGSANGSVNGTPTSNKDGNVLLDCIVCQRQIASNRYAPHLSTCMGLSSSRRGPTRGSTASGKPKLPSEAGRSASPASEAGNGSDDRFNGKARSKTKGKQSEEPETSLKRKRAPGSPQTSPNKITKKAKPSGSPVSRVRADPDATGPLTKSHFPSATGSKSKIPSRLRESSTTSFLERSPSVATSRSSSPVGTPGSSAFSAATQSPNIRSRSVAGNGVGMRGRGGKAAGTGPPTRRVMSPPRPPPPIVHHGLTGYIDDGGDETGSSTDTNSD